MPPVGSSFISNLMAGNLAPPSASTAPVATGGAGAVAPVNQGVYWTGADNNIYTREAGQNGVKNIGPNGVAAIPKGLKGISDPNPPAQQTISNNNTGNTPAAPASPVYSDKSNSISVNQAGLASAGATRDTAVNKVQDQLNTIMGLYNTDASNANTEYTNEGNANQNDLQSNKEAALQTAVHGRQGLYGTLASLGALSGTGLQLANEAVQTGANQDLTRAADTYATNQNALDSAYNHFKNQDAARRLQASTNAANNEEQAQNDYYKNQQTYLKNIGDDYQAEGKTAQAKGYYDRLAALFPQIAATNVPAMDIGYSGSAYTAPTLASYLGQANNTVVQSTPGVAANNAAFSIPGLLAANRKQVA